VVAVGAVGTPRPVALPRWTIATAAALIALFTLLTWTSVRGKSAILHEHLYAWAGYRHLVLGDYAVTLESPPLLKQLAALPLLALHPDVGPPPPPNKDVSVDRFFYENRVPADVMLARARLPFLVLGVLLGAIVFRWAADLYGAYGGLLAVFLYALDPALLGQAGFANHDFGLACFTVVALWTLWRACVRPTAARTVVAGIAFGLALVTKFTALLLVPTALGLGLVDAAVRGGARAAVLGRRALQIGAVLAVAALVVWADYGFRVGPIHLDAFRLVMERIEPDGAVTRLLARAPDRLTLPAPEFIEGAAAQMIHGRIGHVNYLFGQVSSDGWWYYFLVTILWRTPLALLVLLALRLVTWHPGGRPRGRERLLAEAWVLVYAVLTFLLFSLSRTQLGERYVLVVYPLLFVFLGGLVAADGPVRGPVRGAVLGLLLGWYAGGTLALHPDYLTYFNAVGGGPDRGWRAMVEGVDLGQDARGLQEFVAAHDVPEMKVSCFGCPPPARLGPRFRPLPCGPTTGWLAVSVRHLVMPEPFLPHGCFDWLEGRPPVARIGHSIWVWNVPGGAR
jgi:Dolichyl-phosphate-mannose-protein mannosyltransferase